MESAHFNYNSQIISQNPQGNSIGKSQRPSEPGRSFGQRLDQT